MLFTPSIIMSYQIGLKDLLGIENAEIDLHLLIQNTRMPIVTYFYFSLYLLSYSGCMKRLLLCMEV